MAIKIVIYEYTDDVFIYEENKTHHFDISNKEHCKMFKEEVNKIMKERIPHEAYYSDGAKQYKTPIENLCPLQWNKIFL